VRLADLKPTLVWDLRNAYEGAQRVANGVQTALAKVEAETADNLGALGDRRAAARHAIELAANWAALASQALARALDQLDGRRA